MPRYTLTDAQVAVLEALRDVPDPHCVTLAALATRIKRTRNVAQLSVDALMRRAFVTAVDTSFGEAFRATDKGRRYICR